MMEKVKQKRKLKINFKMIREMKKYSKMMSLSKIKKKMPFLVLVLCRLREFWNVEGSENKFLNVAGSEKWCPFYFFFFFVLCRFWEFRNDALEWKRILKWWGKWNKKKCCSFYFLFWVISVNFEMMKKVKISLEIFSEVKTNSETMKWNKKSYSFYFLFYVIFENFLKWRRKLNNMLLCLFLVLCKFLDFELRKWKNYAICIS